MTDVKPGTPLEPCPFCGGKGQTLLKGGDGIAISLVAPAQVFGCLDCRIWRATPEAWNTRPNLARNAALEAALRKIERRTRRHPDDNALDDKRDKAIAHRVAIDALLAGDGG